MSRVGGTQATSSEVLQDPQNYAVWYKHIVAPLNGELGSTRSMVF